MAQLQQVTTSETVLLDTIAPGWREYFASIAWSLYNTVNPEQEIVTVRKWFLSYTFRVKDCRPVLVILFGEPK